jgi:hypothetical protein
MLNKTRDFSIMTVLIAFLIVSISFPVFLGNFKIDSTINYDPYENGLSANEFTKDNYTAILTNDEHGLGSVSINDMHFNEFVLGVANNTPVYPLLDVDLASFALEFTMISVEFIEALNTAIWDNLNGTKKNKIAVKLNETIQINYTNPNEGYLVYFSHFEGAELLEFYVDNGNSIIKLTEDDDFIIDSFGYLVFYYENYFQKGPIFDFKMHLIWDYDLLIGDWALAQRTETHLIMREPEQELTQEFTYQFLLIGLGVLPDRSGTRPIPYIDVALTVNPPDKELLNYQDLIINIVDKNLNDYVNPDNSLSIELTDHFSLNNSFISLNFTCDFGLKFEEPVGESWAIDRLVAERNIRERIYFISIVTGPPHIFLRDVALYDTGIFFDQVISANSLFNREVLYFDANASVPRQSGLKLNMPYLILGETCPFTIRYIATQTLKIIVTDNIKMPLIGVNIEILHFGAMYGTYVSNKSVQPIHPGTTDGNGEVVLFDVPRGNYTVRVIWQGKVVKEATVTTDKEVNYVFTTVPHFPLWILIFGSISGIILVVGALFYLKNKKKLP